MDDRVELDALDVLWRIVNADRREGSAVYHGVRVPMHLLSPADHGAAVIERVRQMILTGLPPEPA